MRYRKLRFDDLASLPKSPGIYQIHTNEGVALKVGIAKNLYKRLRDHATSKQSRLKLKLGGCYSNPSDVQSKQSILAKHLYFDSSLDECYDLKTEKGRQQFLIERCHILFSITCSREEARELERDLEKSSSFRYVRHVLRQ